MFFKHFAGKHQRPGLSINELKNGLNSFCNNFVMSKIWIIIEMFCAIWYHLHNLKNVKNTHGGVLLLVKLKVTLLYWYVSRFLNYIPNCENYHLSFLIVCSDFQDFSSILPQTYFIQWNCILESCFTHAYIDLYCHWYSFRICNVWHAHNGTNLFSSVVERKRHFEVITGWVIGDLLVYCTFSIIYFELQHYFCHEHTEISVIY